MIAWQTHKSATIAPSYLQSMIIHLIKHRPVRTLSPQSFAWRYSCTTRRSPRWQRWNSKGASSFLHSSNLSDVSQSHSGRIWQNQICCGVRAHWGPHVCISLTLSAIFPVHLTNLSQRRGVSVLWRGWRYFPRQTDRWIVFQGTFARDCAGAVSFFFLRINGSDTLPRINPSLSISNPHPAALFPLPAFWRTRLFSLNSFRSSRTMTRKWRDRFTPASSMVWQQADLNWATFASW